MERETAARRLSLPRRVHEQMLAHARAALPFEAVGLLGGSGSLVSRGIPLPNALGEKHFLADPYAQYRAMRDLQSAGMEVLAVYHSHPGGGVDLSDEDLRFARRMPWLQVVIALDRPDDPAIDVAVWVVSPSQAREAALDLLDS